MTDFAGRTAWVTGASSGIGEALAAELFARGANLVVSARDRARLEALRERLLSSRSEAEVEGREVLVQPLDLTDRSRIAQAAEEVYRRAGRVDLLVHAAGISQRALAAETGPDVVRTIMETDFLGPVELTLAVLPAMLAAGSGRIAVLTSVFGKFGAPTRSSYAAAKHALHGYFDSLRCELPARSFGITLVVAGAVATQISANALTADGTPLGEVEEKIARGMGTQRCAKQIADAILREREELYVALGPRARAALLLKRIAPTFLTRILRNSRIT